MVDPFQDAIKQAAEQGKLSAFNMAQLDLYRLHVLLSDCNTSSRNGNLFFWKRTLDALYRELCPHFRDDEQKSCEKIITKLIPDLKSFQDVQNKRLKNVKAQGFNDAAYTGLSDYEVSLRKIMKRMGINLPSRGVRSALSGGD